MLMTLDCYQELFWFATGHVICNDGDAMKFTEGGENDCYHL
jgi:hypothetical protein